MKYFNPSYWFKLWVLSAPLFNDKIQGINAMSIDNQNIKDWANNNTSLKSIENQELNLSNNQTNLLDLPLWNTNLTKHNEHHKHRHQKSRNRDKRQAIFKKSYIKSAINLEHTDFEILFTPEFFEETNSLSKNDFINKCISDLEIKGNLINDEEKTKILELIYSNLSSIRTNYINSSKLDTIKIKILKKENTLYIGARGTPTYSFKDSFIENNQWYSNKYIDNLNHDFPSWNSNVIINLGSIYDNNYENSYLKYAISKKYPNFNTGYINFQIEKYSNFCTCFLVKMIVKNTINKYSIGHLNAKFSYITQTKLDEISDYIANDSKVKQWLKHINDYNKNLPTKIEHLKSYRDSQKWNAKNTEKEIIKGYIRDWSYIHTLIEHELKLDELNKNVQGIKSSFDSIKNQVNDLDNRVQNLENIPSPWNCVNIATISTAAISVVPVVGTVGGAIATITAGACAIVGV